MASVEPGSGRLRVVSWNCRGGLPGKADRLLGMCPDVAVVQECAPADELAGLVRVAWFGRNERTGLGVFVRPGLDPRSIVVSDAAQAWCVPVQLAALNVDVVGVWGFRKDGSAGPPRKVARDALADLAGLLDRGRAVLLGDFNDGPHFDAAHGRSFALTWDLLEARGYRSLHHARSGERYGVETVATFFQGRGDGRPFFIDHAFVPEGWLGSVVGFEIGDRATWRDASDHLPLVIDLDLPLPSEWAIPTVPHEASQSTFGLLAR